MQSCCFIGHKDCPITIKEGISFAIKTLIHKGVQTFYVGTQGSFDRLVYEVLCDLEKKYSIQVFVVLAYLNPKKDAMYYNPNKTIFPDVLTKTPLRFAIHRKNRFMLEKSNYVIAYLNTPFSNTYTNIEEAVRKKKQIINLGQLDIKEIVP